MSTTAAIYARLSRDVHKGTDREGESTESQIRRCREWIESQGWTVGEIYADNNISASSGAVRPEFEQMLRDAPPVVVYRHQDRLERGAPGELERFLLAGCEGYGIDGSRASFATANSELVTRLNSILGRHEQRLKGERARAANRRYAEAGRYRGSLRPFGQTLTGEWVPGEAEAVREAVENLLAGKTTFYAVARTWNDAGLTTPRNGKRGGKPWSTSTVRKFFSRARLMGYQEYEGDLYALTDWRALMTGDEWEAMQSLLGAGGPRKTTTRPGTRLLSGILTCDECGQGMYIQWKRNSWKRADGTAMQGDYYPVYRCSAAPPHTSVVAEPVESIVKEMTLDMISRRAETDQGDASKELTTARHERRELETSHARWMEEAAIAGLQPSILAARQSAHDSALSALDARIIELEAATGVDILRDDGAGWDDITMSRQREIIASLMASIRMERVGRGRRFRPEMLHIDYTPLGERYAAAYIADESAYLSPTRGRSTRSPKPVTDMRRDPWPGLDYEDVED